MGRGKELTDESTCVLGTLAGGNQILTVKCDQEEGREANHQHGGRLLKESPLSSGLVTTSLAATPTHHSPYWHGDRGEAPPECR